MTGKFRDGSQYQASSARIAKYLNRAGAKLEENTEKLQQLNTIREKELGEPLDNKFSAEECGSRHKFKKFSTEYPQTGHRLSAS